MQPTCLPLTSPTHPEAVAVKVIAVPAPHSLLSLPRLIKLHKGKARRSGGQLEVDAPDSTVFVEHVLQLPLFHVQGQVAHILWGGRGSQSEAGTQRAVRREVTPNKWQSVYMTREAAHPPKHGLRSRSSSNYERGTIYVYIPLLYPPTHNNSPLGSTPSSAGVAALVGSVGVALCLATRRELLTPVQRDLWHRRLAGWRALLPPAGRIGGVGRLGQGGHTHERRQTRPSTWTPCHRLPGQQPAERSCPGCIPMS